MKSRLLGLVGAFYVLIPVHFLGCDCCVDINHGFRFCFKSLDPTISGLEIYEAKAAWNYASYSEAGFYDAGIRM